MTRQDLDGSTVVFDLDGTLIDTAPDLVGATNHVLSGLSLPPRPEAAVRPWISFGARRMIEEALEQSGQPRPAAEVDRLLALFLDHYEANIARGSRPYPHVLDEIRQLRSQGARIAVCTNKREALAVRLIETLALGDLFAAVIGRDTLAVSKPDPGHLTGTIARAGGIPTRAVMIGDSGVDIATARAARVPVVGVTFGYSDVPMRDLGADVTIDSYANLSGVIRHLLAAR